LKGRPARKSQSIVTTWMARLRTLQSSSG
jgi:hypothetical protein